MLCLTDWNDDSKLALALLTLRDFNLTYCKSTKIVLKIGYRAEDILLDLEEGDEIDQDGGDQSDKPGDEDGDHSDRSDAEKDEESDEEEDSHRGEATV